MKRQVFLFILLGIVVVLAIVVYTQWGGAGEQHDVNATLKEMEPDPNSPTVPYGGAVEGVAPPVMMGGGGGGAGK